MKKSELRLLSERISSIKNSIKTEEATKTSLILPFIQIMGFDIFNPKELIAEYTADIGNKKGEKVDYMICRDDEPLFVMECKKWSEDLDIHKNQLIRYYQNTKAQIAILTNGLEYKFYTDLDEPNILNETPFFVFNILNFSEFDLDTLQLFAKNSYSYDNIANKAKELDYSFAIKNIITKELNSPSKEFVTYFIKKIFDGRVIKKVYDSFEPMIKSACKEFLKTDVVESSLKLPDEPKKTKVKSNGIVTTEEEISLYNYIVEMFPEHKEIIGYRDYKGHFSVVLNNSPRQIICKAFFDRVNKYVLIESSHIDEPIKAYYDGDFSVLDSHKSVLKAIIEEILENIN